MWTGSVSPVIRQKAKGSRPARNLARRAARRACLPGYPVDPRPLTLAEVRPYFAGDRIVCLRCGKPYRELGRHLGQIHNVTEDEYRAMYGLPWRRGLTSASANQNKGRAVRARIDAGRMPQLANPDHTRAAQGAGKRPKPPYCAEVALENLGAHAAPRKRTKSE